MFFFVCVCILKVSVMPAVHKTTEEKKCNRDKKRKAKLELVKKVDSVYAKHELLEHYKSVNGRLRRMIKEDQHEASIRQTSVAISQCTIYTIDLILIILNELELMNKNTDKKHKKKITPSILRYVLQHSPKLRGLNVQCYPSIETQLLIPSKKATA